MAEISILNEGMHFNNFFFVRAAGKHEASVYITGFNQAPFDEIKTVDVAKFDL